MIRNIGSVMSRVVGIVAGLLLVGIVLRLIVAILSPVLPAAFMRDLNAGWNMLYGIVSPAMAPLMAVLILLALCWVVLARGR
jgi:hypothetical protein